MQENERICYPKCVICHSDLKWGRFAYDQEMCWACFRAKTENIIGQHTGEEAEILRFLLALTAEYYGCTADAEVR